MMGSQAQPAVWFPAIRAGSGTDVFTERLAEGLHRRGLRAEITWLPHRTEYVPLTVRVPKPPPWANIVHVNTWLPGKFLPAKLPIVATMHHCVHDTALRPYKSRAQAIYHRLWIKQLEWAVLKRASRIIAVSRFTAERTKAAFRLSDIAIIHNGIDLDGVFQPVPRQQPHSPFRLLYVGNWSARKGVDLLAPIMQELGPAFELRFTATRDEISGAFPENMRAIGRPATDSELARIYREADALLFPSRLEGFGLVALEAQASGLPVIATRGSALPEIVENGISGLLCPQDDARAFADAARRLAANPVLWQDMRQAARRRVESQFSLDAMIDRYLDVYQTTLANKPTPS